MLSSISPVGEASRRQRWWITAGAYTLASVVAGAAIGAVLGGIGQLVGLASAPAIALALLGVAAFVGLALDGRTLGLTLPTWHRQVDERWLGAYRGWVYGAGFGFQLGLGVVTIVTASITYVALLGAALTGSWLQGAAVGAAFGLSRSAPLLLAARVRTAGRLRQVLARLIAVERPFARATSGVQATLGLAAIVLATTNVPGGPA